MHCTLNKSNDHKAVNGNCHKRQVIYFYFYFFHEDMIILLELVAQNVGSVNEFTFDMIPVTCERKRK